MTKAERLELLRSKLRRNRPIQEPLPSSKPNAAPQAHKQAYRFHPYGLGNPKDLPEVGTKWIYAPCDAQDPATLEPRRIKRKSPLVKIAEYYFKRLRRR